MIRSLSKPLSSPTRVEKFPPPLMRFLKSNAANRSSRARSRSTSIFYLRSRKGVPRHVETTREPSSPKVTCIGQVRPRRAAANRRRRWSKVTLTCGGFSSRIRRWRSRFRRLFCNRGLFSFKFSYRRKADDSENSFSIDSRRKFENQFSVSESEIETIDREIQRISPPKNALLLTRSRSAPHRSSSLCARFCDSPLTEAELGEKENRTGNDVKSEELGNCSDEDAGTGKELENSSIKETEDLKKIQPLMLTRCKSEPASTGERLNPEAKSRLEFLRSSD